MPSELEHEKAVETHCDSRTEGKLITKKISEGKIDAGNDRVVIVLVLQNQQIVLLLIEFADYLPVLFLHIAICQLNSLGIKLPAPTERSVRNFLRKTSDLFRILNEGQGLVLREVRLHAVEKYPVEGLFPAFLRIGDL